MIRPYHPSDDDAIRSLLERTPLPDGTFPSVDDWPVELDDIGKNFSAFWVAVGPSKSVIGTVGVQDPALHPATIEIPDFLERPLRTARLRRLNVDPLFQRQGFGRRLSETVIDWVRNHGFERVVLDTTTLQLPAIALYESMGFRQAGLTRFRRWDIAWFELLLPVSA